MLDIAVELHRWAAEGAVYDLCVQALQDGRVVRERFGYSEEDAFAVGLTCGNHEFPMRISPDSNS